MIVQLKTSSPEMTVKEIRSDGCLICEWKEGDTIRTEAIPLAALKTPDEQATVLKSDRGGHAPRQRMTVAEHLDVETTSPRVRCMWFEQGVLKQQIFSWSELGVEFWMNGKRFKHVPRPFSEGHD